MASATQFEAPVRAPVSVEDYLSTSWHPDREYVEGRLIEPNVGEMNHAFLQTVIALALRERGLRAYTAPRFQVKPKRFRLPDVMALAPGQKRGQKYQQETPYVVVEILSPDDRIGDLNEKLREYFEKGVPNVWVVDPGTKMFTVYRPEGTENCRETIRTSDGKIELDVRDIFRQMEEDEEA